MTGDTHYNLEILAELAEGLLDDDDARPVREHLAVCDPCGEQLADLAAVREVLAATPTPAMPMGVALRIDQAIAAEAGRQAVVAVAGAPDWGRLMADSPWEVPAVEPGEPAEPAEEEEPVRLGVVAHDGTVVPAKRRPRPSRHRKWLMPVTAAAATFAVVGSVVLATIDLGTDAEERPVPVPNIALSPDEPREAQLGSGYKVTASTFNYSDADLHSSLSDYFAPAPAVQGGAESVDAKLDRCVAKVSDRVGKQPFQVDQGYYLGQEAMIMLFWKDRAADTVQVRVLGPECKNLRKPGLAKWK